MNEQRLADAPCLPRPQPIDQTTEDRRFRKPRKLSKRKQGGPLMISIGTAGAKVLPPVEEWHRVVPPWHTPTSWRAYVSAVGRGGSPA